MTGTIMNSDIQFPIAVMGTGWITDKFVDALLRTTGSKSVGVTAVYSRTVERGKEYASSLKQIASRLDHKNRTTKAKEDSKSIDLVPHRPLNDYIRLEDDGAFFGESDWDAFVNSDRFVAVYIASPNYLHDYHVSELIKYGKNVLCEKPVSLEPSLLSENLAMAEKRGVVLMEAMRTLYVYPLKYVFNDNTSLIESTIGPLGDIPSDIDSFNFEYGKLSSKAKTISSGGILPNVFRESMGGGALNDLGCYTVHPFVHYLVVKCNVRSVDELRATVVNVATCNECAGVVPDDCAELTGFARVTFNTRHNVGIPGKEHVLPMTITGTFQYSKIHDLCGKQYLRGADGEVVFKGIGEDAKITFCSKNRLTMECDDGYDGSTAPITREPSGTERPNGAMADNTVTWNPSRIPSPRSYPSHSRVNSAATHQTSVRGSSPPNRLRNNPLLRAIADDLSTNAFVEDVVFDRFTTIGELTSALSSRRRYSEISAQSVRTFRSRASNNLAYAHCQSHLEEIDSEDMWLSDSESSLSYETFDLDENIISDKTPSSDVFAEMTRRDSAFSQATLCKYPISCRFPDIPALLVRDAMTEQGSVAKYDVCDLSTRVDIETNRHSMGTSEHNQNTVPTKHTVGIRNTKIVLERRDNAEFNELESEVKAFINAIEANARKGMDGECPSDQPPAIVSLALSQISSLITANVMRHIKLSEKLQRRCIISECVSNRTPM